MRFRKDKCKVLSLGGKHFYSRPGWGAALQEWRTLGTPRAAVCPGSKDSCFMSGQECQLWTVGRDHSPFLSTCETISRCCIQFWGHQCKKEIDKLVWVQQRSPSCLGTRALARWGETEGTGLVQPQTDTASEGNQQPPSTYGKVAKKIESGPSQKSMERK